MTRRHSSYNIVDACAFKIFARSSWSLCFLYFVGRASPSVRAYHKSPNLGVFSMRQHHGDGQMGRRDRGGCGTGIRAGVVRLTSAELERVIASREAEHYYVSQLRKEEENRKARHDLRRRALRKRELRHSFLTRRVQNFVREATLTGTARMHPTPPSPYFEPRKPCNEPVKKDWAYYKRTGCIWSDFGRLPQNRLPLVVRPMAVKRDRECMERLMRKVEQEEDNDREAARMHQEQVNAHRAQQLERAALNRALRVPVVPGRRPSTEPTPQNPTTATGDRPSTTAGADGNIAQNQDGAGKILRNSGVILSQRQEQLARPKRLPNRTTLYVMLGSADLQGLLCTDPALEGGLPWHVEELRKKVTAARFARYYYDADSTTQRFQHYTAGTSSYVENHGEDESSNTAVNSSGVRCGTAMPLARSREDVIVPPKKYERPHTSCGRCADAWPFSSVVTQGVASVEFDSRATLGDEESLSTTANHSKRELEQKYHLNKK